MLYFFFGTIYAHWNCWVGHHHGLIRDMIRCWYRNVLKPPLKKTKYTCFSLQLELYFKLVAWSIFWFITPLHVGKTIIVDYGIQWNRQGIGGITRWNKNSCAFDWKYILSRNENRVKRANINEYKSSSLISRRAKHILNLIAIFNVLLFNPFSTVLVSIKITCHPPKHTLL